jgi:hypothetical protein
MNRQEGGWRQWAEPVESVSAFEAAYNALVGTWSKDEYGEYCPVTCIGVEKKVIPPVGTKPVVIVDGLNVLTGYSLMGDGEVLEPSPEVFVPHDVGPRGQVPVGDLSGELQRLIDGTLTYEQVRELASDPYEALLEEGLQKATQIHTINDAAERDSVHKRTISWIDGYKFEHPGEKS